MPNKRRLIIIVLAAEVSASSAARNAAGDDELFAPEAFPRTPRKPRRVREGCIALLVLLHRYLQRVRVESILVPFGPARRDVGRFMQHRRLPSAENCDPFADGFDDEHQNHHG